MERLSKLQEILGVRFSDPENLTLALIHSSCVNESPGAFPVSNERLEFLGDAVIGLIMAENLYHLPNHISEGDMTNLRSELVQSETLAKIAIAYDLGSYLHMGVGEENTGGRKRDSILAATLESMIGAIFVDQGYANTRTFVLRIMAPLIAEILERGPLGNPKSDLQEFSQSQGLSTPIYRIISKSGTEHSPQFTAEVIVGGRTWGTGTGPRKSSAERSAAADAMHDLNI